MEIDGTLVTSMCLAPHCVASVEVNSNSGHGLHREYLAPDREDLGIAEALSRATFTAIPDISFSVGWRIDAFVSMNAGIGRAAVNFQNTVSFVEAGPVFDVPEGYTVDGPCIVGQPVRLRRGRRRAGAVPGVGAAPRDRACRRRGGDVLARAPSRAPPARERSGRAELIPCGPMAACPPSRTSAARASSLVRAPLARPA